MTNKSQFKDLVPHALRREWAASGLYPDRDLFTLFAYNAAAAPDREAVVDDKESITYAALYAAVVRVATFFQQSGIGPGDIVAVQLPNTWRSCAVELAVVAVGGIVLPYPIGRGRRESQLLLSRSRATAAVAAAEHRGEPCAERFRELTEELPTLKHVFTVGGSVPGTLSLDALFEAGPIPRSFRPPVVDPDSPARILVSSGSETEPKMVLYSHNALAGGRGAFLAGLKLANRPMRNFFLVPLGSAFGSSATFVTLACHGETLITTSRPEPGNVLRMIEKHSATHVFSVPTLLNMMLASLGSDSPDLSSLRTIVSGGAPVAQSTIEECRRRFGCCFINLYGSADGVNCHTSLDDALSRVTASVGRPRREVTTIKICDSNGVELPTGEEGEIWSRGPMSPMCYVNSPELDARYRTADGWVRTGDLGRIDESGYLTVSGRSKEVIIRGGHNISPAELEHLLMTHPAIMHAACIGVPDDVYGEKVCACIMLRPGECQLTLDEVKKFLSEDRGLEHRKLPDMLKILDEVPVNPAGKVSKRDLQAVIGQPPTST